MTVSGWSSTACSTVSKASSLHKYATLAKYSQDTAHRDILALVEHAVLIQNPEGGRSTSYALAPIQ
jgi:Fic family protein